MRSALRTASVIVVLVMIVTTRAPASASKTPGETSVRAQSSVPVQSAYDANENFCAQPPLTGTVRYVATSGRATLRVAVGGLPPRSLIGVDWANNTVRGYLVGTLRSDAHGVSRAGSEKLFRAGETRGYKLVLTSSDDTHAVGTLWPCGPPPISRSAVAVDPKVSVSPASGLGQGQPVTVGATGFGEHQKVYLSECGSAEEANDLGCGVQLAAQRFLSTGAKRSGSTEFAVRMRAATTPNDTSASATCAQRCVIVATQGDGFAWAVAPIAFR